MAYSIGLDGTLVNGLPPWITKGWSQGPDFSPLWCAKWRFQPNISFTFPCSKQLNSHCREFWLVEPSFYKVVIDNVASGISMISMDISWDINEFSGYHILSYHIISRDIYIYTHIPLAWHPPSITNIAGAPLRPLTPEAGLPPGTATDETFNQGWRVCPSLSKHHMANTMQKRSTWSFYNFILS